MGKRFHFSLYEIGSVLLLGLFFLKFSISWTMAFFILGWLIGSLLGGIEQWVVNIVAQEKTDKTVDARSSSLAQIFTRLSQKVDLKQTTLYSPLFLLIFLPLAWFILTSTGSPVGAGLIIALGWQYASDLLLHQRDIPYLRQHYYSKLGLDFSKEVMYIRLTWLILAVFALMLLLTIV